MTSHMAESIEPMLDRLKSFPGFISHASGPVPGGYQVIEVWESQGAHERWVQEVVLPTLQQLGLQQPLPPSQYLTLDRAFTR